MNRKQRSIQAEGGVVLRQLETRSVLWMAAEFGFDKWDAYMVLTQVGKVRLGSFVVPKYTVGAMISKRYLK